MADRTLLHGTVAARSWLIAMAVWLSGCAAPPTELPPTASATMVPPTATASPSPSATPAPSPTPAPMPTSTPTPFIPRATIKIAIHGPLSGGLAFLGTNMVPAAELAVSQTAPTFEELGFKIELVSYDDQGVIGFAVDNAREIIADPEILCGVGNFTSLVFIQTREIYHRAGLAFISPSATQPRINGYRYVEINRVIGRDDVQGRVGAMFARSQELARAFVVIQKNEYSERIAKHFRTEAGRQDLEVVGIKRTGAMTGFQSVIDALISTRADVVFFSTLSSEQAGGFLREARAAGYQGVFLGSEGIANPGFITAAGPLATEGGGVFYTSIAVEPRYYHEAAGFISDFQTRYDKIPQIFSAQAFDAAAICLRAILNASEAEGGAVPTRAEVATAIRALQAYRGISGTYTFNEYGDPDPARYFVLRVASVDPDDWSENTIVTFFDMGPPG